MRVLVSDGSKITNIIMLADDEMLSAGQYRADDYPAAVIGTPIVGLYPTPQPGDDYEFVDGAWVQVEALAAELLATAKTEAEEHFLSALRRLSAEVALELLTDGDLQAATGLAVAAIKSTGLSNLAAAVSRETVKARLGEALAKLDMLKSAIAAGEVDAVSALAA